MSYLGRRLFTLPKTPFVRASSTKSVPVPKTQETQVEAYDVSGVPPGLRMRTLRIYSPAKTAMSSGVNNTGYWLCDFDVQAKWENPVMGWTSSADPVQALNLKFATKEDAMAFADKQGWDYWIEYAYYQKG
jgi:NADH dehydrogenase (ubiquinone) Fe-S protein 4